MTNNRESLESRLDDLPMMSVDLPNALILLGDAFDIDPAQLVRILMGDEVHPDPPALADFKEAHGAREVEVMIDLIFEAVDSSRYLPFILQALEIAELLAELED